MPIKNFTLSSKSIKIIIFLIVSLLLLFLNFYINLFRVAHKDWFAYHQLDAESYIIGRMVKSRQDGISHTSGWLPHRWKHHQ